MGTSCNTIIYDDWGSPICTISRHYDGYPDGHGKELFNILRGRRICNGIHDRKFEYSIGMHDLAAYLVFRLKSGNQLGNIYLCATERGDNKNENYGYTIYIKESKAQNKKLWLKVNGGNKILYNGLLDNFEKFLKGKKK